MLVLLAICFILARASAGPGKCPDAKPMDNFQFSKYAQGRWFEIARYPNFPAEAGADCAYFDYETEGPETRCTLREIVDKRELLVTAAVSMAPGAGSTAKLLYSAIRNYDNVTVFILDTDYDNYVIFYYCTVDDATQKTTELGWIKSRTPTLKPEIKSKVDNFVKATPILDIKKFIWDSFTHADCLIDV